MKYHQPLMPLLPSIERVDTVDGCEGFEFVPLSSMYTEPAVRPMQKLHKFLGWAPFTSSVRERYLVLQLDQNSGKPALGMDGGMGEYKEVDLTAPGGSRG